MEKYYVIVPSDDDVYIKEFNTKEEVLKYIGTGHDEDFKPNFFDKLLGNNLMYYGDGYLIIKGMITVPFTKTIVTEWDII